MTLIPLAIWTIAGLIAFWPSAVSTQVAQDVSGYAQLLEGPDQGEPADDDTYARPPR